MKTQGHSYLRSVPPALAALTLAAVMLAACGSGDAAPPTEGSATPVAADLRTLDEYFEITPWIFRPPEEELKRMEEEQRETERLIAECMREQGFEYIPEIHEFGPYEGPEYETLDELKAAEGYSVFAWKLEHARNPEPEPGPLSPAPDEAEDPNQAYLDSLSPAEHDAYWLALEGDEAWFEEHEGEEHPGEVIGCNSWAWDQVGPSDALQAVEDEYWPLYEELEARISTDARYIAAEKDWSACMTATGHPFSSEDEIIDYLLAKEAVELERREPPDPDVMTTTTAPVAGEDDAAPPDYLESLERLFAEEMAIAAADLDCSAARDAVFDQVRREHESRFIADHEELVSERKQLLDAEMAG